MDTLKHRGLLDEGQAGDLIHDAMTSGKEIVELTVEYGLFRTQDEFWAMVADEIGAEYYDLATFEPPPDVINSIPAGMARLCGAFPIQMAADGLHVALTDPLNPQI
ncbi:MAG: pilus assembly protein PilB, partial [Verrucomicrobiaceae bacterium]